MLLYVGVAKFRNSFWKRRIVDCNGGDFNVFDENPDDATLYRSIVPNGTQIPWHYTKQGIAVAWRGLEINSTLEGVYASLARQISEATGSGFRLRNVDIYQFNSGSVPGIHELAGAPFGNNSIYAANFVPLIAMTKRHEMLVPRMGRKRMRSLEYMEGVRELLNGKTRILR